MSRFLSTMATRPPINDMIKPLSWLLGKWRSEDGQGHYPTIKDFKYIEELEFIHVGQPNIQFRQVFYAFNAETKKPMHREVGFIRVTPDLSKVAFVSAQNTGLAEVEEGTYNEKEKELRFESHTVGRLTFGKPPVTKKIARIFHCHGDTLEQIVDMETVNTAMTNHLTIKYKKVE
ncbi:hypothetical protein LSH36_256g02036 [Paralvinella palmiformis]|uniref:THAP4-like heme-binding domain-containing protein n=1 Tax=Paralvinella palmiformis TaxID=53620 RepID=A0AAD9JLE4_9ANNE|nr:hypothetical protein LSH36_256g02036 [Paralvinella palmiformis]